MTIPAVKEIDDGTRISVISGGCTVNDVSPVITLHVKCECLAHNSVIYFQLNRLEMVCSGSRPFRPCGPVKLQNKSR